MTHHSIKHVTTYKYWYKTVRSHNCAGSLQQPAMFITTQRKINHLFRSNKVLKCIVLVLSVDQIINSYVVILLCICRWSCGAGAELSWIRGFSPSSQSENGKANPPTCMGRSSTPPWCLSTTDTQRYYGRTCGSQPHLRFLFHMMPQTDYTLFLSSSIFYR